MTKESQMSGEQLADHMQAQMDDQPLTDFRVIKATRLQNFINEFRRLAAQSAAPVGGNTCYVERSAVRMIMLAKDDELGLLAVDELKIYTAEDFVAPPPSPPRGIDLNTIDAIIADNVYVDNDGVAGISTAAEAILAALAKPGDS